MGSVESRIRLKGGFGLTPGKLLTLQVKLTVTPKEEGAQRGNFLPGKICETPSVDSTVGLVHKQQIMHASMYCERVQISRVFVYVYVSVYVYIYICVCVCTHIYI